MKLADLHDESALTFAERRDALAAQRKALALGDKRARFTAEEIQKRASRLPRLEAIKHGLGALQARRADVPDWILSAFERGENE